MTAWLARAQWFDIIAMAIGTIAILATVTGAAVIIARTVKNIRLKTKNLELSAGEPVKNQVVESSLVQHLEVRDYRHLIREALELVKDDIRYRVRRNGWEDIADWPGYREPAITQADIIFTRFMDEHYYFMARVDRLRLFDYNEQIAGEISKIYRGMYDRMLEIVKAGHKAIAERRAAITEIQAGAACSSKFRRCGDVIRETIELVIEEQINIKAQCMTEAERALQEIAQELYSHYLTIYKQTIEGAAA